RHAGRKDDFGQQRLTFRLDQDAQLYVGTISEALALQKTAVLRRDLTQPTAEPVIFLVPSIGKALWIAVEALPEPLKDACVSVRRRPRRWLKAGTEIRRQRTPVPTTRGRGFRGCVTDKHPAGCPACDTEQFRLRQLVGVFEDKQIKVAARSAFAE